MNMNISIIKAAVGITLLLSLSSCKTGESAGKAKRTVQTLDILTSAQCDMCKKTIENTLSGVSGIRSASLSMVTKKVTVRYLPEKITPDKIRRAITDLGYDADREKGNPEAYKALPACCKKP
jgi:mercuric ion binding protein